MAIPSTHGGGLHDVDVGRLHDEAYKVAHVGIVVDDQDGVVTHRTGSRGEIEDQHPLVLRGVHREQAPAMDASDLAAEKQSDALRSRSLLRLRPSERREGALHLLGGDRGSVEHNLQAKMCARGFQAHVIARPVSATAAAYVRQCPHGLGQEVLVGQQMSASSDVDVETPPGMVIDDFGRDFLGQRPQDQLTVA